MPRSSESRIFRNEQLVLRVSESVDPAQWDESRYEPFFEALCGPREFQKTALRTALRYLLSGRYDDLKALANENFSSSEELQDRYGTVERMEQHLLFPDRLYCTLDLATGTGKSYVLYGLAMVLLAEGAANRVLALCPSNTIEAGLIEKFRRLAGDSELRDALPEDAKIHTPRIIRADETIADGCLCVENYHAVLGHVRSSIRDSLTGHGENTLVLNDEVHHVASGMNKDQKRWKEFLADPAFGFRRIVGASGTCYIEDDYFADVISRYSLRQAIEDGVVKNVDYVAEEEIGNDPQERFQIILDNHKRSQRQYRQVKPLTIMVTRDIKQCEQLAEDWIDFLAEHERMDREKAARQVLVVTSSPKHQPNIAGLAVVDRKESPVEWIMSVSMLTEGWDVKNVFQIVPHEKRAFDSKLLIAQVLGRGLRVPEIYAGKRPVVTVFNHDAWSRRIEHLVQEVLEIEKRLTSRTVDKRPDFHFEIHHIQYDRKPEAREYKQVGEYDLLKKGYVKLPSQQEALDRAVEYERATTGERFTRKTKVTMRMYGVEEVAEHVLGSLKRIDEEAASMPALRTSYAKRYGFDWCVAMVRRSIREAGENKDQVSEENRQKILQALGPLERGLSKAIRYRLRPDRLFTVSTQQRPASSVSVNALQRGDSTLYFSPESRGSFLEEELAVFDEILSEDSDIPRRAIQEVPNSFCFKTPLNIVIADHDPERRFIQKLIQPETSEKIDAWIKSSDRDFYSIEFSWKKGEHTKRGSFNPDFFLKQGERIFVAEVKDDGQVSDPEEENRAKWKAASDHFKRVNEQQEQVEHQVNFISPQDFDAFFQRLRAGELPGYRSHLDCALAT
jgi:type III restriction enzyme